MTTRRSLSLFATPNDLMILLRPLEEERTFAYVQEGAVLAGQERQVWSRATEIPNLGIATNGDQAGERALLLVPTGETLQSERVIEYSGRVRDIVDQSTMPASVMLRAGGVFGQGVIIAGQMSTISDDPWSKRIYGVLAAAIRKRFQKIKSYYVGEEAAAMLRNGARLTFRAASPPEYDLRID